MITVSDTVDAPFATGEAVVVAALADPHQLRIHPFIGTVVGSPQPGVYLVEDQYGSPDMYPVAALRRLPTSVVDRGRRVLTPGDFAALRQGRPLARGVATPGCGCEYRNGRRVPHPRCPVHPVGLVDHGVGEAEERT